MSKLATPPMCEHSNETGQQAVEPDSALLAFEHAPLATIVIGSDGAIMYANETTCRMLGYDRNQLLSLSIYDIDKKYNPKAWQQYREYIKKTGTSTYKSEFCCNDGHLIPVEVTLDTPNLNGTDRICMFAKDTPSDSNNDKSLTNIGYLLNSIAQTTTDAIVMMDSEGKTTFWNKAAEKMFGFSRNEVLGNDCHDLIRPDEFKEQQEQAFHNFLSTGNGAVIGKTVELRALKKSGEDFPIEMTLSASKTDGGWNCAAIIRDITERVAQEAEFAQTVSNYLALINTVPAQMYLKDIDHKYIIANEAYCSFIGRRLDDIIGATDYDFFPPDKADLHHQTDKKVIEKGDKIEEQEERCIDLDGNCRWLSTTKVPLHDNQGLACGLVAITQDVTDQHLSREQLVQADKLAAIGTLAAGVAHEINNPMGFINSNLNTMNKYVSKVTDFINNNPPHDTDEADKMKDILVDFSDAISESIEGAERVKKIVADLKSFSRVDKSELEAVCINEGLDSTLNIVWNELKYKCTVEKDYGDIPDLFCIPNQLNQVFLNLLVNAGHAIDEEGGKIVIKTWSDESSVMVSIKDTGRGIPREIQGKIFEPFFTTKDVGKGTGLGLSLAYDIIKKHKGKISVESELGKGSEFIIRLPLKGLDREQTDSSVR